MIIENTFRGLQLIIGTWPTKEILKPKGSVLDLAFFAGSKSGHEYSVWRIHEFQNDSVVVCGVAMTNTKLHSAPGKSSAAFAWHLWVHRWICENEFSLSILPLGFSHKSELVMCKKKAAHDDYWKHVSGSSAYHWNLVHQIGQAERNFKIKGQRLRFQFKYLNFAKFRCSYNFFFIYFS